MKVNRDLKDSRIVSLIKSIQDMQKDMKKKEENNQND